MIKRPSVAAREQKELPGVFLLPYPYKSDSLFNLSQPELRAWFDHMEGSQKMMENDIVFVYKMGDKEAAYRMAGKSIILPGGAEKRIEPGYGFDGMRDAVKKSLGALLGDGNTHLIGLGLTKSELMDMLIDSQFQVMKEHGIERHGQFQNVLGTVRNRSQKAVVNAIVDLGRAARNGNGAYVPDICMHIGVSGGRQHGIVCEYHTHPHPDNLYPSQGDLILMRDENSKSVVIATRRDDRSYNVVEWVLKPHMDLNRLLDGENGNLSNPFGWLRGKKLQERVDEAFERRNCRLSIDEKGILNFEKI
jgi:hypothetical protein